MNRWLSNRMLLTRKSQADASILALNHPQLAGVQSVLERMVSTSEDSLVLFTAFIDTLRPSSPRAVADAPSVWEGMLSLLAEHQEYRESLGRVIICLFADRDLFRFYTEAGMLPNTGFFSELRRILVHKILPEISDPHDLKDCIHLVFSKSVDQEWMAVLPAEHRIAFWQILGECIQLESDAYKRLLQQLLVSMEILAHRIAAMGLEPELLRVNPRLRAGESPFIALVDEGKKFAAAYAFQTLETAHNELHLLVLLDQCRTAVQRAHQTAAAHGTSMPLTFLLVRLTQHLDRFELLVKLLAVRFKPEIREEQAERWSAFMQNVVGAERQRNNFRRLFSGLLSLLSLRVTENAAQTGEHYIATDRAEWLGIWRAAAGAGFLITLMAVVKIFGSSLHLAVLIQGLLNGSIYAGGFVIIHLCHGIVATKQPAMTAATIAATISQTRGRLREIDRLAELVVATVRSQFAAIAGNVLVALPLAIVVCLAIQMLRGSPMIPPAKAATMLRDIYPVSGAPFYAAIAGIWLFMAGLVSGLVDNQAAYGQLGERVARHPHLVRLMGAARSARLGAYLDQNAGGLAGNIFFGMMLGLTPAVGLATGLPLNICHIAFSAANLGYSLTSLDFRVEPLVILRSVAGVALIGALNLAVSFCLALWVALRSRDVDFTSAVALLPELKRRLTSNLARFFVPPRDAGS